MLAGNKTFSHSRQEVHIPLTLRTPELDAGLQVGLSRAEQSRAEQSRLRSAGPVGCHGLATLERRSAKLRLRSPLQCDSAGLFLVKGRVSATPPAPSGCWLFVLKIGGVF